MTTLVACVVCARPLDHLLTNGLQAGVGVMTLLAVLVVAGLVRGALAVVRRDQVLAAESNPGGAPAHASR